MATTNPTNRSFLTNNKYELVINRLPNVVFFLQALNLPNITLSNVITQTPFVELKKPGNQLRYEDLTVNYILDEDMQSWLEIYNWMTNLGNPETKNKIGSLTKVSGKSNSITSDMTILIKTNANNPNIRVSFYDAFPIDLGGVQLTSTEGQDFLTSTITFTYNYYKVEKI